jgi:hypothetical protein
MGEDLGSDRLLGKSVVAGILWEGCREPSSGKIPRILTEGHDASYRQAPIAATRKRDEE